MGKLVKNAQAFLAGLNAEPKKLEKRILALLTRTVTFAHAGVTGRTPVWSGTTLRNYHWSLNAPVVGYRGDPGGVDPGHTNSMPLGPEPRRAAAQAEADASLAALTLTDPYVKVYLTNNAPAIEGLEYGIFPQAPLRQRSPAGMFRVTLQEIVSRLKSGAI